MPKTLRAVVRPREFEAFRGFETADQTERAWSDRPDLVLAHLAHTVYYDARVAAELLGRLGAESFHAYDVRGAQALLARWPGRAVLVFRGSEYDEPSPLGPGGRWLSRAFQRVGMRPLREPRRVLLSNDVIADLKFFPVALGEARVHRGFLSEFRKLWPRIERDLLGGGSNEARLVTGHSLGAALATLAGLHAPFDRVVTFGEPRVGVKIDREFRSGEHTRYVNGRDPVPLVPFRWPFGFEHHGDLISLRDPDGPSLRFDHGIVYYAELLDPRFVPVEPPAAGA